MRSCCSGAQLRLDHARGYHHEAKTVRMDRAEPHSRITFDPQQPPVRIGYHDEVPSLVRNLPERFAQ